MGGLKTEVLWVDFLHHSKKIIFFLDPSL